MKTNISFFPLFTLIILFSFLIPVFADHSGEGHHSIPPPLSNMSPYLQFFLGYNTENIECKYGLELHIKTNGFPICVKESTFEKLIERAYPFLV